MKKLGKILCEIQKQSKEEDVRFEDVLSHDIRIKKTTAQKCQKAGLIDIDVGQDMQEVLIKTYRKSEEIKNEAVKAVQNGESVERVTSRISAPKNTDSPHDKLIKEKNRIEKTITVLNQRLEIVLEQLEAA